MRPSTIWYTLKQGIKNIKRNWSLIIVWTNIKSKIWLDYTNSISTSIAASPLRGPILTILV